MGKITGDDWIDMTAEGRQIGETPAWPTSAPITHSN
jgi:hypothetical protein